MNKLFTVTIVLFSFLKASGQTADTDSLLKQAAALSKAGQYVEAVTAYRDVLKIDSVNPKALYELAYALRAAKQPASAVPYLEQLVKAGKAQPATYSLLGSVYDAAKQPNKAIAAYREGIKLEPASRELYYNLAIVYYKQQNFAAAEKALEQSLTIDSAHALSHRMYALAAFHQGKKSAAVLAFCNFLMLDPQSPQAAEAYTNIERIFTGSITAKKTNKFDSYIMAAQQSVKSSIPINQRLQIRLMTFFTLIGEASAKSSNPTFFDRFYAKRFYELAKSPRLAGAVEAIGRTAK